MRQQPKKRYTIMFRVTLHYGKHSGYVSHHATLTKAIHDRNTMVRYYADLSYPMHEATIVETCDTCNAEGVTYCSHKTHGQHGNLWSMPAACKKVCTECQGRRVFYVELEPKYVLPVDTTQLGLYEG